MTAACASDGGTGRASISDLKDRYAAVENIDRWSLPLDPYHGMDGPEREYALNVATQSCMAKQGFDFQIPAANIDGGSPTSAPSGRKLFTEDIAAQYGYGEPARTQDQKDAFALNSRRTEGAELKALTGQTDPDVGFDDGPRGCIGQVNDEIGRPDEDLLDSLELAAYDKAMLERRVTSARKAWKACVDEIGVTGLPDKPEEMPGELRVEFGLGGGDGGSEPRAIPSRSELELATADAACRDSSGYTETLYRAEFEAQLRALDVNDEELDQVRRRNEAIAVRARKLIAESAGN